MVTEHSYLHVAVEHSCWVVMGKVHTSFSVGEEEGNCKHLALGVEENNHSYRDESCAQVEEEEQKISFLDNYDVKTFALSFQFPYVQIRTLTLIF